GRRLGQGDRQGRTHRILHALADQGCRRPRRRACRPGDRRLTDPEPPSGEQPGGQPARPSNPATTPREPPERFTAVGRVLRPHALRGELRVMAFSASAANLQRGRPVYLAGERRAVLRAREDREAWIIQLEGISDRTAAERYRGELLETPDAE